MGLLLFGLFIVVPVVEIWLIVKVGHLLGVLPTVALLVASGFLGSYLLKREGSRAWAALRATAGAGKVPAREAADGALVVLGGALLLAPGFLTDVVGLLCVLPLTRPLVRSAVWRMVSGRVVVLGALRGSPARGPRRPAPPASRSSADDVIEGEVVDEG